MTEFLEILIEEKKKSVLFKSPDNIKNKIFQIVYHGFRKHFLEIYY